MQKLNAIRNSGYYFYTADSPPTQSKILATPMLAAGGLVIIKGKIWGLIYKQILGKILKFSASFT